MKAHYATTTPFYRHVVSALSDNYDEVTLQRRFQIDDGTFRMLSPLIPNRMRATISRRVQPSVNVATVHTFRRWSFEPAIYARLGRQMPLSSYRNMVRSTAKEVRDRSRNADVLQFTDGIGHLALRDRSHRLAIMERRHVHHDVLRAELPVWEGFPTRPNREPIPDVLQEEYASADAIVVYSDAARATFLNRGFAPQRVFTVHRGASSLPPVEGESRDPRLAVYVGRGDADKGLDLAVGAIESLKGDARLQVAGPLTREVLEWLKRYQNVEYVGLLNRIELSRLYARASLLLMPSIESFGLAMTDAASVGVRVICADTAGIGPEFGAKFSTIVSKRDVEAWSATVGEALEAETDELRQARAADDWIQRQYSWSNSEIGMRLLHRKLSQEAE